MDTSYDAHHWLQPKEVSSMIAFVYNQAGIGLAIVHVKGGPNDVKRQLREEGLTQPGNRAVFVSGLKARKGTLYMVAGSRRQWVIQNTSGVTGAFERSTRDLTGDEREYLQSGLAFDRQLEAEQKPR